MHKTFNVLIVDDDEDDQFLIKQAFEHDSERYRLHFASDGTDVLEDIESPRFLPDLVLLDLNMPIIDGFEVLTHFKKSPLYRHIPVVILTTSDLQRDIDRAYELGANTFISKPTNHQDLLDLAEHIRGYWFKLAKMPRRRTN